MTHAQTKTALRLALKNAEMAATRDTATFAAGCLFGTVQTLYGARSLGMADVLLASDYAMALSEGTVHGLPYWMSPGDRPQNPAVASQARRQRV